MSNFLKNITALALLGVVFFVFRIPINREYQTLKDELLPCRYPITYSIGTIDSRFGLSSDEFLQSIEKASKIWDKVVGRQLFVYKIDGDLKINLKYDTRQDITNKLSNLNLEVSDKKNIYNNLKIEYDLLRSEIDQDKDKIKNQNDVQILNQKINKLNQLAAQINQSAQNINSQVSKYNTIGSSLGDQFEEGLYFSDKNGRGIDVYQFKNNENLVRLLAHEFGHALALEHSNDKDAIMYYLENSESLEPSSDDIRAIKTHCKIK